MILVESLEQPSIELHTVVSATLEQGSSWIKPYVTFLSDGSLPEDGKEAEGFRGQKLAFGYPVIRNCTDVHLGDLTCYACFF